MRASQTVLPFKLTASDESLTAHAGLVLFDEYLGAMGIAGLINHELPGAGSAVGYDPSAHVAPLVLMLAGGGRTLEDLRVLRRDDGLRCVVGLDEMPSSDASGDWMRRMGANESGGLAGLQRVTVACSAVCFAPTSARTSRSTSMRRRSWRKSVRLVTAIRARRVTCRWWGISRKTVWPSTTNSEKAMRLRRPGTWSLCKPANARCPRARGLRPCAPTVQRIRRMSSIIARKPTRSLRSGRIRTRRSRP